MLYGLVTQCANTSFKSSTHVYCMFSHLCRCLLVVSVLSGSLEGNMVLQAKQQAEEDARAAQRAQQQAQAAVKAQEEARAARQAEEEAQAILSAKEEARAARQAEEEAQAALKAEQQARAALQAELEAQSALRAEEAARAARRAEEEAMAAQQAKAQAEVNMHYVTCSHVCICTTSVKIFMRRSWMLLAASCLEAAKLCGFTSCDTMSHVVMVPDLTAPHPMLLSVS